MLAIGEKVIRFYVSSLNHCKAIKWSHIANEKKQG